MAYSIVGILTVFVLLIVNVDVFLNFRGKTKYPGEWWYLAFLASVIVYCITDGCWGFLYEAKLREAVYVDTVIYFFAMATSILLWGSFVYHYLDIKHKAGIIIPLAGVAIFVFQSVAILINFGVPILFEVSNDCVYTASWFRYVILIAQILVFLLVAIYAFISAFRARESARRRKIAIALLSLFMAIAIILQACFPLMPLYAMGFLFGICLLHTFVIRDEMTNRLQELNETKHRISLDPLTGTHSKYAYIDAEARVEDGIADRSIQHFAVVVFDINDLKKVNDTYGHDAGDKYIKECADLICEYYKGVPIYRVGGDEFATILLGKDYEKKDEYLTKFERRVNKNKRERSRIIISSGMAEFVTDRDTSLIQVFTRADREMYARKERLKRTPAKAK